MLVLQDLHRTRLANPTPQQSVDSASFMPVVLQVRTFLAREGVAFEHCHLPSARYRQTFEFRSGGATRDAA